mmetsp:Transcript_9794/g.30402  ORF Transcript_9794/g.30402 Transcript_9794/m.30402 type:complete len:85 (+) Transcript_9794:539-793(+)
MELSRKDDLMSVGYLIVYMFNGQLPWSNVSTCDGRADYAKTLQAKRNTRIEQLCSGLGLVREHLHRGPLGVQAVRLKLPALRLT